MKKLTIVNWRWETLKKANKNYSEIDINENEKLVCSRIADESDFNFMLESMLGKFDKNDECLILTHFNETSQIISIPEDLILLPKEFIGTSKINEFSGGEDKIYFGVGNKDGLFDPGDETIKTENFHFIWDYYWNQLEVDYQKKKLINTFLPLAIDMQGLFQTSDGKKKEDYINEIVDDIKSESCRIIEEWSEIKEVLGIGGNEGLLSGKFKLSEEEKDKFNFPLENELKENFTERSLKQFSSKGTWANQEFFLPNWLEKAVKILDSKIEAKNI